MWKRPPLQRERERRGALPTQSSQQSVPVASLSQVPHSGEDLSSITKIKANWFCSGTAWKSSSEALDTWLHSGNRHMERQEKWPISLIPQGRQVSFLQPPKHTHYYWACFQASIFIQHITAGLKSKSSQSDFMLEKFKGSGCLVSLGWLPKIGKLTGAPKIGRVERLQCWSWRGAERRPRLLLRIGDASLNTPPNSLGLSFPTMLYKTGQVEESVVKKQNWGTYTHTIYILVTLKNQISKISKS